MNKPKAVVISDVHYSVPTLKLADAAMRMAIAHANRLGVPLIVAGDLHDTKANLRAECVNAMIETFNTAKQEPFVLRGNHDAINEKSEEHALNFLAPYATLVPDVRVQPSLGLIMIPYYHDAQELNRELSSVARGSTLIMHQGILGSNSGDYIQDKSALSKENVAGLNIISGHYHTRQTIALPEGGTWNYIGNPYTLTYGEAYDPPKGYQLLLEDNTLQFVPTNLRKHVIISHNLSTNESSWSAGPVNYGGGVQDLVWVKITGTKEDLNRFDKTSWLKEQGIPQNVRLTLTPLDTFSQVSAVKNLTGSELLDKVIDTMSNTSEERKTKLKQSWRNLCE